MKSYELRKKYLEFFKSKRHNIIPSASLIPENDPTVLFTTAGMHPLVPYLLGQKHPQGVRLTDSQKCIRTGDIEEVGDNRHLTFFEMLGNWSLGDYFKKRALEWSWEFLTEKKWLGLDPKRFFVTVFMGNENSSIDNESIKIWKDLFDKKGIKAEVCPYNKKISRNFNYRIFPMPSKDNWWGPAGQSGPCGPCSEMFYDTRPEEGNLQKTFDEEVDDFRIMEIWNDVFMEFNKNKDGSFQPLKNKNVDTGMGLERTITVLNGEKNVFNTDLFAPIIKRIEEISGKKYLETKDITRAMRIIADHIKATTFIMADEQGVLPSNKDQGYIVRRLIRRAVLKGIKILDIRDCPFTQEISEEVIKMYNKAYPELEKKKEFILNTLKSEEQKFNKTLELGLKEFNKFTRDKKEITGKETFYLYESFGFPLELILEEAKNRKIKIDEDGFQKAKKEHQEKSRQGAKKKFTSGLADTSEETTKLHTATHLLHAALKKVLRKDINQKGSNITAERLRFDFNFERKLTEEEKQEIEVLINKQIQKKLDVKQEEMSPNEAKSKGAIGLFNAKYGDKVSVYSVGDFSKEICSGPHVKNIGDLGRFKIKKEQSAGAGIRRIKAILE